MTPSEAAKILLAASAFDNRDATSEAAAKSWALALADVPADPDAFAAVNRFYGASTGTEPGARRWLEPHHLRTIRRAIRAERIPDGTLPPPAAESGVEFAEQRQAQIRAIADGRATVRPIRELTGGPDGALGEQLQAIGAVPDYVREAMASASPRGRHPEWAIPCRAAGCNAAPDAPCTTGRGRKVTGGSHPTRLADWRTQQHTSATSSP